MEIRLKSVRLKLFFFLTPQQLFFYLSNFFVTRFQSKVKMSPIAVFLCTGKELHMDLFQFCQLYACLWAACINDLSPNSKKKRRKMKEWSGYFFSLLAHFQTVRESPAYPPNQTSHHLPYKYSLVPLDCLPACIGKMVGKSLPERCACQDPLQSHNSPSPNQAFHPSPAGGRTEVIVSPYNLCLFFFFNSPSVQFHSQNSSVIPR